APVRARLRGQRRALVHEPRPGPLARRRPDPRRDQARSEAIGRAVRTLPADRTSLAFPVRPARLELPLLDPQVARERLVAFLAEFSAPLVTALGSARDIGGHVRNRL